jgi:GT2 family glycosyltransferase
VYNTDEIWLRKAIESVQNQIYPNWELCLCDDASTASHVSRVLTEYAERDKRIRVTRRAHNGGISAASNDALALASGEFVGLLDHDDELTRDALFEVVQLLNEQPELDFIYSDEDKLSVDGRREEPFFKPDWSPDLLHSMNYITHFSVMRRSLVEEVGGFTEGLDGSQDHDLFFRLTEKTQKIGHITKPLYSWRKIPGSAASDAQAKPYAHVAGERALEQHLRRLGEVATVEPGLISPAHRRVRYQIIGQPLVSIIIPIRDKVDLLRRCLTSIQEKTTYRHFEIIIIDNQSEKPETLSYLAQLPHTVIQEPNPFNYSRINNVGVAHARGEFILFLNNDIEVIAEEWLTALLEHAQHSRVGAVGAKLLYPDRTIQHAGVVIGLGGVGGHVFHCMPEDAIPYFGFLQVVRNCSAVTAACMMMRKSVFDEVGGFDENVKVAYNDVDLCLRIREKGYFIVYTPYALLYHFESSTRKNMHPLDDEAYVRQRWAKVLQEGDPYYNPHLTLERPDYSLRILDQGAGEK